MHICTWVRRKVTTQRASTVFLIQFFSKKFCAVISCSLCASLLPFVCSAWCSPSLRLFILFHANHPSAFGAFSYRGNILKRWWVKRGKLFFKIEKKFLEKVLKFKNLMDLKLWNTLKSFIEFFQNFLTIKICK